MAIYRGHGMWDGLEELTPEHRKQLREHFNLTWKRKTCPMCETNAWNIAGTQVVRGKSWSDGELVNFPTAVVICTTCGNTLLVNLIVAKIVEGGE